MKKKIYIVIFILLILLPSIVLGQGNEEVTNSQNVIKAENEISTNTQNTSEKENINSTKTINNAKTLDTQSGIKTNYTYNKDTNTVLFEVISDIQFKETKALWNLSEDKLTYSHEFDANTDYISTFEDIEGNKTEVEVKFDVIDETGPTLSISYKNNGNNTITATVTSNEELLADKTSWQLSEDKLSYVYTFTENSDYDSTFKDKWGNPSSIHILITDINSIGPKLSISYRDNGDNTVTATVTSDRKLLNDKTSWQLSEDKLSYVYTFTDNTNYVSTFQDEQGNKSSINVIITTIDKTGPNLSISYKDNGDNTVTATVTSNEELLADKTSWQLSADKLSYTFTFKVNSDYDSTFKDKWGNPSSVHILITQIDDQAPKTAIQYIHNDDNTVTVKLIANEVLKDTKVNWTLSADKTTYSHTFSEEFDYYTEVQDLYGNVDRCHIKAKMKTYDYEGTPNIKVKYMYTGYEVVKVEIVSDVKLKNNKSSSWTLSADGYRYTKEFSNNDIYTTGVEDINGNKRTIPVIVNFFGTKSIYNGVDVSFYQKYILWDKVIQSGIDFAMIRAGFRGYGASGSMNIDPYFETNLKNAAANGLDIGIYFYSQAITVDEAVVEANFVLDLLKKYNIEIKYPIAIDTERTPTGTGRADSISKELRTEICKTFCDVIEQAGYKSMIYANKDWLLNNLNINELNDYDIWLAHYTNETDYPYAYTMWQYTSSGIVNGIAGYVDMNYCYKKY